MNTSIIIPLWNGASVIAGCLQSLRDQNIEGTLEVICVDNASEDGSAEIIKNQFPEVRLLSMPVNLGFAGGVNAGIGQAQGNVLILLNQDCSVHPGWLNALLEAVQQFPDFGLYGSTIYNPDGSLNHTGAAINRPDAVGMHLRGLAADRPQVVDYLTGAALAIPRRTWDIVGKLDEGFYPAYYEDCDYGYRARQKGLVSAWVPGAKVTHLFSNQSWQKDPIKTTTENNCSRFRFVCKHFTGNEISAFFQNELSQLDTLKYLDAVVGRMIAGRYVLKNLEEILSRRRKDLGDVPGSIQIYEMRLGLSSIIRKSYLSANHLLISALQGDANPGPPSSHPDAAPLLSTDSQGSQPANKPERQTENQNVNYQERIPGYIYNNNRIRKKIVDWLFRLFPDLLWTPNILSIEERWLNYVEPFKEELSQLTQLREEISRLRKMDERLKLLEILAEYDNR